MRIHEEVLRTAIRLCRESGRWAFAPNEIVRRLPHLNPASVRTHIVSRCCVNAPRHHAHAWDYFKRVERGVYEIQPKYRRKTIAEPRATRVAERAAAYRTSRSRRDTVHAVVTRDGPWFVAECLEVAVVTQARTLDEVASALKEAVALHLEGEDLDVLGVARSPRLVMQYETSVGRSA